jgi:hypothetical protein
LVFLFFVGFSPFFALEVAPFPLAGGGAMGTSWPGKKYALLKADAEGRDAWYVLSAAGALDIDDEVSHAKATG